MLAIMKQITVLLLLAAPCTALLSKKIEEKKLKPGCYRNGVFTGMSQTDVKKITTLAWHQPYGMEDKSGKVEVLQVNASKGWPHKWGPKKEDKNTKRKWWAHKWWPQKEAKEAKQKWWPQNGWQHKEDKDVEHCPTKGGRRVFLRAVGHSYHGTTALSQLVMSSTRVATLCKAETWQCEGGKFLSFGELTNLNKLELYDRIWDLSQPVLFEKWAITNGEAREVMTEVENGVEHLSTPTLNMKAAGIKGLDVAFVIMWRPLCLADLSSHKVDTQLQAEHDLLGYAQLLRLYRTLVDASVPVMVMSYGDLVFNPQLIEKRMYKFVPCLGHLNSNYKVQEGKDVYQCNTWKATGSIKEFGQSLNAQKFGYDIHTGTCKDKRHDPDVDELLKLSRL